MTNKAIIKFLNEYKSNLQKYISFRYSDKNLSNKQRSEMEDICEKLTLTAVEVNKYIIEVDIDILIETGPRYNNIRLNPFINFPNLVRLDVPIDILVDFINMAIGQYEIKIENRKRNRFNPLYWIGELIRIPFHIAKFAGFNSKKIELSLFGKIYKFLFGVMLFIIAVYELCDILLKVLKK